MQTAQYAFQCASGQKPVTNYCPIWCLLDRACLWQLKNKKPTRYHLLFYCASYRLNMIQALLCPSSLQAFSLQTGHYSSLTAPNLEHTTNQEQNDQCGNQHHSHELLMMGIVMPESCWAYKKHNKINKWHLVGFLFFSYCPICFNICTVMLMLKLTFQMIQTHDHPCNNVQLTCKSVHYICISCSNMVSCLTNLALLLYKGVLYYVGVGSCHTQTTKRHVSNTSTTAFFPLQWSQCNPCQQLETWLQNTEITGNMHTPRVWNFLLYDHANFTSTLHYNMRNKIRKILWFGNGKTCYKRNLPMHFFIYTFDSYMLQLWSLLR